MQQLSFRALELPLATKKYIFRDLQNSTTQDNVNSLAEAGIISTSTTKFKPSQPVTRGQMALFLYRAIHYQEQINDEESRANSDL